MRQVKLSPKVFAGLFGDLNPVGKNPKELNQMALHIRIWIPLLRFECEERQQFGPRILNNLDGRFISRLVLRYLAN